MNCREAKEMISYILEGDSTVEEMRLFFEHLESCSKCSDLLCDHIEMQELLIEHLKEVDVAVFFDATDLDNIMKLFEEHITLPKSSKMRARIDRLVAKGKRYLQGGGVVAAKACFASATKLGSVEALRLLGELFERMEYKEKATECCEKAASADHSGDQNNLG